MLPFVHISFFYLYTCSITIKICVKSFTVCRYTTFCCKVSICEVVCLFPYMQVDLNALDQQVAERKRLEEEEQQRHEAFGEIKSA